MTTASNTSIERDTNFRRFIEENVSFDAKDVKFDCDTVRDQAVPMMILRYTDTKQLSVCPGHHRGKKGAMMYSCYLGRNRRMDTLQANLHRLEPSIFCGQAFRFFRNPATPNLARKFFLVTADSNAYVIDPFEDNQGYLASSSLHSNEEEGFEVTGFPWASDARGLCFSLTTEERSTIILAVPIENRASIPLHVIPRVSDENPQPPMFKFSEFAAFQIQNGKILNHFYIFSSYQNVLCHETYHEFIVDYPAGIRLEEHEEYETSYIITDTTTNSWDFQIQAGASFAEMVGVLSRFSVHSEQIVQEQITNKKKSFHSTIKSENFSVKAVLRFKRTDLMLVKDFEDGTSHCKIVLSYAVQVSKSWLDEQGMEVKVDAAENKVSHST